MVKKAPQIGKSKTIKPQEVGPYTLFDSPTMITFKLEEFSGKQITRHRSNIVPYYPKELVVQEQMEKYFSDNNLLRLYPKNRLPRSRNLSRLF